MDVSIAVSLIRGQMGAVVERAVNGAVETVLAEMLKVVGVKFEELKAQVSTLKRDTAALQREKAAKEKENDKIRAMLRYAELKLKYYRQGVEEEMQPRAPTTSHVRIHPNSHQTAASLRAPRGNITGSSAEAAASSSGSQQTSGTLTRTSQGPMSPQCRGRPAVRVNYQPPDAGVGVASASSSSMGPELADVVLSQTVESESVLPGVSVSVTRPEEALEPVKEGASCLAERDGASCPRKEEQEEDCEWTISLQPQTGPVDPPPAPPSPDKHPQADSSTLASSMPLLQVKQEAQQEEEQEVICIKEEPEEEQEVMATLLLDCELQSQIPGSEGQRSPPQWTGPLAGQRNILDHTPPFSSAGPSSFSFPQPVSMPSMPCMPGSMPPRQALRPWPKDLSLYEEYKLRRNELRRRSLNRRREMEKTLPQPLLADLVRERREKTRLRVARWRAKRKLQACLMSQAQAQGPSTDLSQQHSFDINSQQQLQQQIRAPCASTSSSHQRRSSGLPQCNSFLSNNVNSSYPSSLPFISSSPSSLMIGGHNLAEHGNQHAVTSSSSSSQPQVSLSQSISLTDSDIFQ